MSAKRLKSPVGLRCRGSGQARQGWGNSEVRGRWDGGSQGSGLRQVLVGGNASGAGAGAAEGVGGQVGQGGVAVYGHDQVGFGEEGAQDVDDAVGAAQGEAVGVGAADGDGGGAQGQGLDDVGAGADARVEQDGQ